MPTALLDLRVQLGGGSRSTGIQFHRCQSRGQQRAGGAWPKHLGENQGILESQTPLRPLPEPGGAGLLVPSQGVAVTPPALPGLVPGALSPLSGMLRLF